MTGPVAHHPGRVYRRPGAVSGPHWLAPGGKTTTPAVVACFDTETAPQVRDGREVLTLRCWDAIVRVRDGGRDGSPGSWAMAGEAPGELAQTLEAAAAITGEAWCFAHNAGFDLTVTSLPMVLAARGWEPAFINLGDETCVFALTSQVGRLVITDSWSWLRCGLRTAARDVGMRKPRLPDDRDDLAAWHRRCAHDTRILDRVVCELLDWWDDAGLGGFAVTGSACGWRSLRAMIAPKQILVGPQHPRTALERDAIYGGRKEVWQVGHFRNRQVEDWDLVAAHLTIMATQLLPARPIRDGRISPPLDPLAAPYGLGAVCRVQITTRTPCAPVRVAGEIWWPVGTFITTLTTPELAAIAATADRVTVITAQWYKLTDHLQDWGRWCLDLQAQPDTIVPRVVKRVAKGWGRAVPGRFALRTSRLLRTAPATHLGWALETGYDLDSGAALETITYAGKARTYLKDQDGADSSPAVLAFVEGYVRAAMARTLAARPACHLLQVNTDGWWEVKPGRGPSDAPDSIPEPFRAVRKAISRDVTIYGPNHTDSRNDRRLAGVPKDAARRLDGSYAWQDWPGLRWQLQFSRPGEYTRPGRELRLHDHYCRRWVLDTGETVPVTVALDASGAVCLLPWSQTWGRAAGDVLARYQVPALEALRGPDGAGAGAGCVPLPPQPGRRSPPLPAPAF